MNHFPAGTLREQAEVLGCPNFVPSMVAKLAGCASKEQKKLVMDQFTGGWELNFIV